MRFWTYYETTVEKKGDLGMTETNAEAIQILKDYKNGVWIGTHLLEKSLQTVIEQDERAQELEKENIRLKDDWKGTQEVLRKSIEISDIFELENKQLRETLKFYANRGNYSFWTDISNNCPTNNILFDHGYRARQILGIKESKE